jgi:ferric-dicitrate binding protein FerR (iron transport regulator)
MSSTPSHRARRALVIGALGVALAGGGAAAVWAASTPAPSPSAPSQGAQTLKAQAHARGPLFRGGLHGEVTAKRPDGTYATLLSQRGAVTEVTDTKLTVKSEDGYTHSYVLAPSTKVRSASNPKGPDLKAGDEVAVRAERRGSDDTATAVSKGPFPVKSGQGQSGQGKSGQGGRLHRSQTKQGTPSPSPSPSVSASAAQS